MMNHDDEVQERQQGLRAQFELSDPSPNAFRPLTVRLDGVGEGGVCTLDIRFSARVAGEGPVCPNDPWRRSWAHDGRAFPPPPSEVEEAASP